MLSPIVKTNSIVFRTVVKVYIRRNYIKHTMDDILQCGQPIL